MKYIIPSAAFTLVGIMFTLFTATSTTSDLFRETTAQIFLIFGLMSIGLYLTAVLLILVRYYCPILGQRWPINQLVVRSPGRDIGEYTSILLPIGASLLIASGNATDPRYLWLDGTYELITCMLLVPTVLLPLATIRIFRRERIDQQAEGGLRDLPSE